MPWDKQFNVDEVLGRAMDAFWQRGYAATSLQDLVKCTGINRASLYATFTDKHSLFVAALRMYEYKMLHQTLAKLRSAYGPRDAIREFFLLFISGISETGGNRGCFLTNTALELAPHDAEVRQIVASAQKQIEDFFCEMIEKGVALGVMSANLSAPAAAQGILASFIGLVVLTRSRPEQGLLQTIINEVLQRLD